MKFLLAGDSDVGKAEILQHLQEDYDAPDDAPVASTSTCLYHLDRMLNYNERVSPQQNLFLPTAVVNSDNLVSTQRFNNFNVAYKSTNVLLDGKRIRVQLWDTSGQGRFSTIIRSYSRGAQGILLVYDITRKWSFNGLDRWIKEIEEHAPGVPKLLIGNRLHLEFNRQVNYSTAQYYARKHKMPFFEVSHLCDYTIREALVQLCRMVLLRNGIGQIWKNQVLSLQDLCSRTIVSTCTTQSVDHLVLPAQLRQYLKSYSSASTSSHNHHRSHNIINTTTDGNSGNKNNKRRRFQKLFQRWIPML